MKNRTNNFKNQIKELGRELENKITFSNNDENIILTNEELNSVTPHFLGTILKSAMKQLDIDSNVEISCGTILNYKFGLKIGDTYEFLDFGNYIVYESEYSEDTKSYRIVCYDKMLYSMVDYTGLKNGQFPMTIKEFEKNLCLDLGLTFKDENKIFANHDKILESDIYKNLGYKYRDIFDELSQVTASTICLDVEDKLENRYINNTNDTIDEEYFKSENVIFKEKYGPVNSIVLSRSAESDNIYLQDESSIQEYGLCEIKIKDNQIMNFNDRDEFLPDLLEKLSGLEFYLNDFSSTGIIYYDLCDKYNVQIAENTYSCIMFNDEICISQGLEEHIFTEKLNESITDYSKADKTDRRIDQTWLIVNKQEKKINALVSTTTENHEQINNLKNPIQEVEGNNHIYIDNALEDNVSEYIIYGKCEQDESSQIYPKEIKTIGKSDILIKINNKNLFNLGSEERENLGATVTYDHSNLVINGKITSPGGLTSARDEIQSTDFRLIGTFEKGEYTLSAKLTEGSFNKPEGTNFAYYIRKPDKTILAQKIGEFDYSCTFSLEEKKDLYFQLYVNSKDIEFNNCAIQFQIEKGKKVTSHKKNQESDIVIDLQGNELCSINEIKDDFNITSGILNKRIGKLVLDGDNNDNYMLIPNNSTEDYIQINFSRNEVSNIDSKDLGSHVLCSHYPYYERATGIPKNHEGIRLFSNNLFVFSVSTTVAQDVATFKTWLRNQYDQGTPITIYYLMNEEQQILLEPKNLRLYEEENYINLLESIKTDTKVRYPKKNALSEMFYTKSEAKAEFEMVNNSITNRVSEINTTLNNNQMSINEKLNDYATIENVSQQISSVENKITSSEEKITIITETLENGISQVKTEKGYTFNDQGLLIDDSNSKSKNLLNEVGMTIVDKSSNSVLLFAGYDEEMQESIVKSKNMTVEKYLVVPNCRFESYIDSAHGKGTGVFDL